VISLKPAEEAAPTLASKLKALNYTSGPSQKDILDFTTQLAVMIRAGISIRAAIEGIADQVENEKFKHILTDIKEHVESGKPFSDALAKHPKHFNLLYINMVRASEMSGSFARMLDRIAGYIAQQIETRSMVRGAMIYPGTIFTMAIGTTIFLLTFVLPRFAMVFKGKEDVLPWPTIFLMGLSDFMVDWWWAVVLAMIGGVVGMVLLALRPWFPGFVNMFKMIYQRANMIASGKMFVVNTLPTFMYQMFPWNPLFHNIDQARGFVFINYFPHKTSLMYPLYVGICLLILGLSGEFYTRRHASLSWDARR